MSSHYRISFSQVVEDVASFATEQLVSITKKTRAFLKQRIVEDLRLYRQFHRYQGVPIASFWEKPFSAQLPMSSSVGEPSLNNTNVSAEKSTGTGFIDKLTPQQVLVFKRIKDIAASKGYEIKALPSPSEDLIIDLYGFDSHEVFKREKIFAKRR